MRKNSQGCWGDVSQNVKTNFLAFSAKWVDFVSMPISGLGIMASCPVTSSYPGHCETLSLPLRARLPCQGYDTLPPDDHCTTPLYMELLCSREGCQNMTKVWTSLFWVGVPSEIQLTICETLIPGANICPKKIWNCLCANMGYIWVNSLACSTRKS